MHKNHGIGIVWSLFACVALLSVAPMSAVAAEASWGEVTYPLPGNLRSESGTMIVHFRIEAESLDADPGPWYFPERSNPFYRFKALSLHVNDENNMMLYWYRGRSGRGRIQAATGNLPGSPQSLPDRYQRASGHWAGYEQHWVAYTWNEQGTHTLWADGQLVRQQGVGSPELGVGPVTAEGRLVLGADVSPLTVYGVHVLDRALSGEQLAEVGPDDVRILFEPRDGSLLLDRFEDVAFEPDGEQQTKAVTISGFSGEIGGTPSAACRFVDTPFGRGLRLFSPPDGVMIP